MDLEELEVSYGGNEAVRAICDTTAAKQYNQKETKLSTIRRRLDKKSYELGRSDVIGAFRQLEEAGCGRYIEGRHGYESRFAWTVKSTLVSDAATRTPAGEFVEEAPEEYEMMEHAYVLRPNLTVTVELPEDLTLQEATRLSNFVCTLSFEED